MDHRGRGKIQYYRRGRGTLRGRGYQRSTPAIPAPVTPALPLGRILTSIQDDVFNNVKREEDELARITNVQYLTSYNWLNKANSEILVPGEPPEWTPLPEPTPLRKDSGQYYRDPNAARYPTYPVEPMIQAILSDKPEFSLRDVDIIGCGNTLNNLLRFASGQCESFRMLVEVIGNTVFFIRRENSPTDIYAGIRGYGHTFPEANTTWRASVQGSETHQRLITYDFAGLKCLVRFEADGFLPDLVPQDSKTGKDHTSETGDVRAKDEDIASSMQGATVSTVHAATPDAESQKIIVSKKGQHIPQSAIFDLKTRTIKNVDVDTLGEELPRLWIRQIPNFILAYHTFGEFKDVRVQDVRENLKRFERDQLLGVVKFGYLLKKIVAFARGAENKKLEIEHREGYGELNLREPGGVVRGVLPEVLMSQWDVKEDVKGDVEEESSAGQRTGIWGIFSPILQILRSIV